MEQYVPPMATVPELQKLLSCGKETAYNLVRRKDFPSIKIGKEYRVLIEKLPAWIEKQQKNK
jgi:excisionase family DNA binding protein